LSENNKYRYYVGNEASFSAIRSYQNLVKEDFHDAFIVAFKNGIKISIQEAKELELKLKSLENK